jgi:hypothetical protein
VQAALGLQRMVPTETPTRQGMQVQTIAAPSMVALACTGVRSHLHVETACLALPHAAVAESVCVVAVVRALLSTIQSVGPRKHFECLSVDDALLFAWFVTQLGGPRASHSNAGFQSSTVITVSSATPSEARQPCATLMCPGV